MSTAEVNTCVATVTPAASAEAWHAAARAAQARLDRAASEGDCAALDIRVSADRSFVVFTTRDGRNTVRPIDSPDDVA
ncbi:MAG: hypothetical protein M3O36_18285, partial [Myxococcota bacterium]|nr:hypothetical protein [Myxococcota bacterium]